MQYVQTFPAIGAYLSKTSYTLIDFHSNNSMKKDSVLIAYAIFHIRDFRT